MSARQYITYAAWLKSIATRDLAEVVSEALIACDLVEVADRRLSRLSGGMLRRTGIAQATVARPNFLILDEPTVGLDPDQRGRFHSLMSTMTSGRTTLISTHLLEDALALATSVAVIEQGCVAFHGPMEALLNRGTGADDLARLRNAFSSITGSRLE